jgi:hypothetical protein
MPKIMEAVVIIYFRDITATLGIPIAVLVYHDHGEVDVHIRKDWQPVLTYDEGADIGILQSFVHQPTLKQDISGLITLAGAENSIRAEKLAGTDPQLDRKLADVISGLCTDQMVPEQ